MLSTSSKFKPHEAASSASTTQSHESLETPNHGKRSSPTPSDATPTIPLSHDAKDSLPKRKKMARTRTGCLNCRRRKRKCDEIHPTCTACTRRGEYCEWGVKLTFRAEHAWNLGADHPSMLRASKRPRNFEILDIRDEVIRDYHLHLPLMDHDSDEDSEGLTLDTVGHSPTAAITSINHTESPSKPNKRHSIAPDESLLVQLQERPFRPFSTGPTTELPHIHDLEHIITAEVRRPSRGPRSPNPSCPLLNADNSFTGPTSTSPRPPHSSTSYSHTDFGIPSPEQSDNCHPGDGKQEKYAEHPASRYSIHPDISMTDASHSQYGRTESHASYYAPQKGATQDVTETAVENLLFLSRGGPSPPQSHVAPSTGSEHWPARSVVAEGPMTSRLLNMNMDTGVIRAATHSIFDTIHQQQIFPTESYHDDGIFVPGSGYLDFHIALRQALFREGRPTVIGRSSVPTPPPRQRKKLPSGPSQLREGSPMLMEASISQRSVASELETLPKQPEPLNMTVEQECALWTNWVNEIAPWLDKFDNNQSFSNLCPYLGKSHDHLKYAMLALSARQLEQTGNISSSLSLSLYQWAVYSLLGALDTRSTPVMASAVILCVMEMMSCNSKMWRRHLDGCASLMATVGINGFVGGLEQALFWTFARLDVCGGLISSERTLIPVNSWASKIDMDTDSTLFRNAVSTRGFQEWANYSVYLVAQVQDLLATPPSQDSVGSPVASRVVPDSMEPCFGDGAPRNDNEFRTKWALLWRQIDDWRNERPEELKQIMCIPSSERNPFPTVLYSNASAISGNQLYHTAALLMLQHKPAGIKLAPKSRSALWHARQICGISLSNAHHGAWTNSIQPLWIAGRCMSHPTEHEAILALLGKIERECGWATEWRAGDLMELWGDLTE